jgi:hypothetical protein
MTSKNECEKKKVFAKRRIWDNIVFISSFYRKDLK